jgi:hypothetical protein
MPELTTQELATLEWLTPQELARRWRKSIDAIYAMLVDGAAPPGKVRARKFGGSWRIHLSAVEEYERGGKSKKAAPVRPQVVIDRGDPLGLYSSSPAPSRGRGR